MNNEPKPTTKNLFLAPGQWKTVQGVRVHNSSATVWKRVIVVVADVVNKSDGENQ